MIHYNLRCTDDHAFDGWFASSVAYEEQNARGLVTCPLCGTAMIEKALMAPALRVHTTAQALAVPDAVPEPAAVLSDKDHALSDMIRALRSEVAKTAEDVGERFAQEARKIHYDGEARSIYGRATRDEARALAEDGIGFLPLPALPEDAN